MGKNKSQLSIFDQEMQSTTFKKSFDEAYKEFALLELLLALMEDEDNVSVRKLAKAAGLSATSIQEMRSGEQADTKASNFLHIANELGYSVVLEKEGKRIHLGKNEKFPAN